MRLNRVSHAQSPTAPRTPQGRTTSRHTAATSDANSITISSLNHGLDDVRALNTILVTNILPPYRRPVFEILAASSNVKLQVWAMAKEEENRSWNYSATGDGTVYFRDWGFDLSRSEGPILHFNPGLCWALARTHPDVVILGGYNSITTVLAAVLLKIRAVPFLFWIESTPTEERRSRRAIKPLLRMLV